MRFRVGATFGAVLAYATGGIAFASFERTYFETPPGVARATFDKLNTGFALGAGAEYRVAGNWSVKAEYLYARFGNTSQDTTVLDVYCCAQRARLDTHAGTFGMSYRFGGPAAPTVAKY